MRLAAVGDNCMDIYDDTGEAYAGGNPVNVAVYFVRIGGNASYTGVVGTDEYGEKMIKEISKKKVDVSHMHRLSGRTAITHVKVVDGERQLGDYEEGVLADFRLSDDDIEFLCKHDLVVSGLWGNVESYFEIIKSKNVKIAFDAATRPYDQAAQKAINSVNYFFYASDENVNKIKNEMKQLFLKGPELVIVTLGERGSIVYDGKDYYEFGIVSCQVIDTMGAGDSYIAGFLKGLFDEKDIVSCMRMGAENASKTIEYSGAW